MAISLLNNPEKFLRYNVLTDPLDTITETSEVVLLRPQRSLKEMMDDIKELYKTVKANDQFKDARTLQHLGQQIMRVKTQAETEQDSLWHAIRLIFCCCNTYEIASEHKLGKMGRKIWAWKNLAHSLNPDVTQTSHTTPSVPTQPVIAHATPHQLQQQVKKKNKSGQFPASSNQKKNSDHRPEKTKEKVQNPSTPSMSHPKDVSSQTGTNSTSTSSCTPVSSTGGQEPTTVKDVSYPIQSKNSTRPKSTQQTRVTCISIKDGINLIRQLSPFRTEARATNAPEFLIVENVRYYNPNNRNEPQIGRFLLTCDGFVPFPDTIRCSLGAMGKVDCGCDGGRGLGSTIRCDLERFLVNSQAVRIEDLTNPGSNVAKELQKHFEPKVLKKIIQEITGRPTVQLGMAPKTHA